MKSSLLYDVKRSLVRPSILMLLILFTVLGIASVYGAYPTISNIFRPFDGVAIIASGGSNNCIVIGGVFNRRGGAVEATITFIDNNTRVYSVSVPGTFVIKNPNLCRHNITNIEISTHTVKFNISRTQQVLGEYALGPGVFFRVIREPDEVRNISVYGSIDNVLNINSSVLVLRMFIEDIKKGVAKLYIFAVNTSSPDLGISTPIKLGYRFRVYPLTSLKNSTSVADVVYEGVIIVDENVEDVAIDLDLYKQLIEFYAFTRHTLDREAQAETKYVSIGVNYSLKIATERAYIDYLLGSTGLGFFMFAFPIAILYLAYTLLAKPRGSGALEFVLVRPITRTELYISRYLSGAIAIAIASAVFVIVISAFYPIALGISLDFWSYALLYIGIIASLITFYTICYTIATVARPGLYLAITIALYIFLTIVWNIVLVITAFSMGIAIDTQRFTELSYLLSYLNPLNFVEFARYHISLYYGATPEIATVNTALCIVTPILWNITHFAVGLSRFKKCILTS